MSFDDKLDSAWEIMTEAMNSYRPCAVIGLFSGGHDSYTVTHFVAEHFCDFTTVAHIDTGIGIPDTQQFVIDRCKAHGWPLEIYRAVENTNANGEPDPQIYDDIVTANGFPGPYGHRFMYIRLKERQINRIRRKYGKVMLISGARQEESTRRMGTSKPIQVHGNTIWVAPFTHMTGSDCYEYMQRYELPENEVKKRLCMSGECLCGAFAKKNELKEIEFWYPEVGQRIRDLEIKVRESGFPWGWEQEPPKWWTDRKRAEKSGQIDAFEAEAKEEIEMLCQSCHYKHELAKTEGQI